MGAVEVVLGGFRDCFDDARMTDGLTAYRDNRKLCIIFENNGALKTLERDARRALGPLPITTGLMWLAGVSLAMAFGAVIIVFLAFLEVFYDLFKQAALRLRIPENRLEFAYFVVVLIAGSAIVSFLPQLFSGGNKGFGNDVLRRFVDNELGAVNRIARRASVASLLGRVDGIRLFNPFIMPQSFREKLLLRFVKLKLPLQIYLHYDEIAAWTAFARENNISWSLLEREVPEIESTRLFSNGLSQGGNAPLKTVAGKKQAGLAIKTLDRLLGSNAASLFSLFVLSSTRNAADPWRHALSAHPELSRGLVSFYYAEHLMPQIFAKVAGHQASEPGLLRLVYERARKDYGLFDASPFEGAVFLSGSIDWEQEQAANKALNARLEAALDMRPPGLARSLPDANALLCAIVRYAPAEIVLKEFVDTLAEFIHQAERTQNFMAAGLLGDVGALRMKLNSGEGTPRMGLRELMQGLPLETIWKLAEMLEAAGRFAGALDLYEWLGSVEPVVSHIRAARLKERLGLADEGLALITGKYRAEFEEILRRYRNAPLERSAALDRMCLLAIRYHLQLAWIIISGRIEKPGSDRQTAADALSLVQGAVESPWCDFAAPMDRWQFWNYAAQLAEWNGDFENCIHLHQRAADVPGLPARWKSASLINLGIALRKRALAMRTESRRGPQAASEAGNPASDLVNSYAAAANGARMKLGLGDLDEAAIGLHNAAYTMLYLARFDRSGAYTGKQAAQLALRGLEVLQDTKSAKKLGLLLAECAFGLSLSGAGAAPGDEEKIASLYGQLAGLHASGLIPASDAADILALHNDIFPSKAADFADIIRNHPASLDVISIPV